MATYNHQDPRLRITKQFGGSLLKKSNAKVARPISVKHGMHVVLRSSQASGEWSFRKSENQKKINKILREQAQKYGLRIYEFANAGDHLQLLVKIKSRDSFNAFIRAVSGMIAMAVTDSAKTRALKAKFWDFRPWSRIVELKRKYSLAADTQLHEFLVSLQILLDIPRNFESYFIREAPA